MPQLKPEIEGQSIVFLGSFNPKIFQPAWLANQQLIREEEAESATIEIIHQRIVVLSTDWFKLHVTSERFQLSTRHVHYYEPLRDLALGIFRILRHTPIEMMGLNRDLHFQMPSEKSWHKVGHRLAPKEPWNEVLKNPGMRSLTNKGDRPDKFHGFMRK